MVSDTIRSRGSIARVDASDEGGDPACWSHLFDADGAVAADLTPLLAEAGNGVHWTLEPDGDLNANLVRLDPGEEIPTHRNDEVDVLVLGLAGAGHVVLDERTVALRPSMVVLLPKGTSRSMHAGPDGLGYLTVHRRRGGLAISR
jgi:quercetin dioxygenase-like cupin family protein